MTPQEQKILGLKARLHRALAQLTNLHRKHEMDLYTIRKLREQLGVKAAPSGGKIGDIYKLSKPKIDRNFPPPLPARPRFRAVNEGVPLGNNLVRGLGWLEDARLGSQVIQQRMTTTTSAQQEVQVDVTTPAIRTHLNWLDDDPSF